MKKTSGNDVFDNSHFLIKDDSDVPSFTIHGVIRFLDGLVSALSPPTPHSNIPLRLG